MNYFPFHVGDYAAHTGHLEPMEDLAYRRLLDLYYLSEGPLPADIQATARLVRMRSMAADVAVVLEEFFELTDAGWMHTRCEQEIGRMQDMQVKKSAAGVASGRSRRAASKKTVDGCLSGVDADASDCSAPNEEDANACSTPVEQDANIRSTCVELPTPTPTPTPTPKKKTATAVAQPVGVSGSVWSDFCQHRKAKRAPVTQTVLDSLQREAAKAAISLEDALREICTRGWVGFEAKWVADRPRAPRFAAPPQSFAERDAAAGRKRWSEMTGQPHPDNAPPNAGNFIDAPSNFLEIEL